jgi:hypothetical protein
MGPARRSKVKIMHYRAGVTLESLATIVYFVSLFSIDINVDYSSGCYHGEITQ